MKARPYRITGPGRGAWLRVRMGCMVADVGARIRTPESLMAEAGATELTVEHWDPCEGECLLRADDGSAIDPNTADLPAWVWVWQNPATLSARNHMENLRDVD